MWDFSSQDTTVPDKGYPAIRVIIRRQDAAGLWTRPVVTPQFFNQGSRKISFKLASMVAFALLVPVQTLRYKPSAQAVLDRPSYHLWAEQLQFKNHRPRRLQELLYGDTSI